MKALRDILDKMKPHVEPGGKFSKLQSVFEGFETFLFVPNTVTKKGAHIRDSIDLKRTMIIVVMALVPALLFGMWNVGYQHFMATTGEAGTLMEMWWFGFLKVLPIIVISYGVGLGIEFVFAQINGHEIQEGFLVSGMLIPLIVPIDTPLWMIALATAFAVVIGKEVFGGTGMNIVNPALTARAFLFFAYPSQMSGDKIWVNGVTAGEQTVDTFSGATPLANGAAGYMDKLPSMAEMFFGVMPGSIGETSTLAILIGAVILIATGIGSWKIMFSSVVGGLLMGFLLNTFATETNPYMALPALSHLMLGGFMFGTVFMATDPVTASQTDTGKWIYGFLVGFIAILVRVLNPAFPEGMMLAILLMNVFAPLIDYYVINSKVKTRLKRAKKLVSQA